MNPSPELDDLLNRLRTSLLMWAVSPAPRHCPEVRMPSKPDPNETTLHCLGVGVGLALKAHDTSDWKPVVDWIVRNPAHASELGAFLDAQDGLKAVVRPARITKPAPSSAVTA